jgi:hypothetical protein
MHGIHKMADNPEPNTETALLTPGHCALEGTEDAGLVLFRDADAVIPNGEVCLAAVTNQRDLDWLASAILDGVRQQVIGDLLDSQLIEQPGHPAFDARFQAATRALRTRPVAVNRCSTIAERSTTESSARSFPAVMRETSRSVVARLIYSAI